MNNYKFQAFHHIENKSFWWLQTSFL